MKKKERKKKKKQSCCVRALRVHVHVPRAYGDDAVKGQLKYPLLFNHKSGTRKGGLKAIFTEVLLPSQVR